MMNLKILKRIAVILAGVIAILLAAVIVGLSRPGSFKGKGSADAPYLIEDARDMVRFAAQVSKGKNYEGKFFALTNDIDLTDAGFVPAGYVSGGNDKEFSGTFDGRGFSIYGADMSIDGDAGLFACVSGRVINLAVENALIEGTGCAGGIAASVAPSGRIYNCVSYASVHGEECGGVVGAAEGKLINCVQLLDHEDSGSPYVTADDDRADLTCCYTTQEGELKLTCNGYEENKLALRQRGVDCLNRMLTDLKQKNPDVDFCIWELRDDFPFVHLSKDIADTVCTVSIEVNGETLELAYDHDRHCFTSESLEALGSLEGTTIVLRRFSGVSESIAVGADISQAYIDDNGMQVCVEALTDAAVDAAVCASEVSGITSVNLDEISGAGAKMPAGCALIRRGYYEGGSLSQEYDVLVVSSKGEYSLSGSLSGYVRAASPDSAAASGDNDLTLVFDNVTIDSGRTPCIDIPECGGRLNIVLAKGSTNTLNGSNSVDIYTQGCKSEGVISSKRELCISSCEPGAENPAEEPVLTLTGDVEGIECEKNLTIDGGYFDIKAKDDGISCGGAFTLAGGYVSAECFDNGVDCDDVFLEGGVLTGAVMSGSEAFVKSNVRSLGTIVAYEGGRNKLHKDSRQAMTELAFSDVYPSGTIIVMTDESDDPILALRLAASGSEAGFSVKNSSDDGHHFYICDRIDGVFAGELCTEVTGFDRSRRVSCEEGSVFAVQEIEKRFKVYEE